MQLEDDYLFSRWFSFCTVSCLGFNILKDFDQKMNKNTCISLIFILRMFFLLIGVCLVRTCLEHYLLELETLLTYNLCKSMLIFTKVLPIWVLLWMMEITLMHEYAGCCKIMLFLVAFLLQQEAWKSFRHLISPIMHLLVRYQVLQEASRT